MEHSAIFVVFYSVLVIVVICPKSAQDGGHKEISTHVLYDAEELVCNKSEAISYLKKTKISGSDGVDYQFTIRCKPLNVCEEVRIVTFLNKIYKLEQLAAHCQLKVYLHLSIQNFVHDNFFNIYPNFTI